MPDLKPTTKNTRIECTCERCQKKFFIIPARKRQGKGRFCSRECFRVPRTLRTCKTCGNQFAFHDRPSRGERGVYCSQECKYLRNDPVERFWAKVDKAPGQGPNGDCWEWRGNTSHNFGYGNFNASRHEKYITTHQYSFRLEYGYLPEQVCHKCDNPPCVNPAHLFAGNAKLNAEDRQRKGRGVRGERQHCAKLKEWQIPEIFRRVAKGEKQPAIAASYGVALHTVERVLSGKTWTYLGLKRQKP